MNAFITKIRRASIGAHKDVAAVIGTWLSCRYFTDGAQPGPGKSSRAIISLNVREMRIGTMNRHCRLPAHYQSITGRSPADHRPVTGRLVVRECPELHPSPPNSYPSTLMTSFR